MLCRSRNSKRNATKLLRVLLLFLVAACLRERFPAGAAEPNSSPSFLLRHQLADYDAEPRLPNGRVDVKFLVARLRDLRVTTYYWLVWHARTDWDDLKQFLPEAARAGIDVWVYLVPPSESPPHTSRYSEPFRLDYMKWAEQIARLSLQHRNLTGWVIDDFYANHRLFTPEYVGKMRTGARDINPRLVFLPLMYFNEITRRFAEDYHAVIDGVVVAYPKDRSDIDAAWAVLNDAPEGGAKELSFPWGTPSRPGDFVEIDAPAQVVSASSQSISFRERDDFNGATTGYHFKQLLVNGSVVWEEDAAGGSAGWKTHYVVVDSSGKGSVDIAFRLIDRKGVSNFGVRWFLTDLKMEGLRPSATFAQPRRWRVSRRGSFQTSFGPTANGGNHRFHIPLIVMTAATAGEFRMRHGEPASPKRMADWVRMCLQAREDGKCAGVVTYCLDKSARSESFASIKALFVDFRDK